ncbi:hypothetical protein COX04_00545 [Candidatus Woesebacteria bacterium CG22_combo_CG10-13_8_21_14_all_45_10]|uniref:Anaphase-promoting complex subunit 4 WD40 domain-containing protein n=1 Tax=Candidatus Woesebacteria bacterium CG22_combo_CG10-13_8_21_14_all_45_10 TaxID=1975060 RepID=A0A2H0BI69_9BACT|nr:MAG: hypothetical protein COX04_00545 [Candidatus Woesebacteria bacterium CG22_combo_CG10-13_8_21_14_all_45_10]
MININPNLKKKWFFFLLGTTSIISVIFILAQTKKPRSNINTPPAPSVSTPQPSGQLSVGEYFLNKILDTDKPITGFSWISKKLTYSTGTGIYEAGNNESVLKTPIEFISWSKNGKAVFSSKSRWYFFDSDSKGPEEINRPAEKMVLSPSGSMIAITQGGSLEIFDPTKLLVKKQKNLQNQVDFLSWSEDESGLLVVHKTSSNKEIKILESSSLEEKSVFYYPWVYPIGLSPNADFFLAQSSNNLIIRNIKNKVDEKMEFTKNSNLGGIFISENELFLTETYADRLQRKITNFWIVDLSKGKTLLANSMPILGGINLNISYYPNPAKSIIPIAANKGGLWFLSLNPGVIPTYQNSDVFFYNAPQNSHKDKGF